MTNDDRSKVFFLPWERRAELSELLVKAGAAAVIEKDDLIAVKMHFGERGGDGFVPPDSIRPVLKMIREKKGRPFLTDTSTIYSGMRSDAIGHLAVAADHGFTQTRLQLPIIIADGLCGNDYRDREIEGKHFRRVHIASAICEADAIIAISHFKGHLLAGFGGAIKNIGMGCGSKLGKFEMHSSVTPTASIDHCVGCGACLAACSHDAISIPEGKVSIDGDKCAGCGECVVACGYGALSITWNEGAANVQERYCEYALGALIGKRSFYINFVNHITPNCDCMGMKEELIAPDVGILASLDPVAIDQASFDLVIKKSGDVFKIAHPNVEHSIQLKYAEEIGLGKRSYEIVEI